MSTRISVYLVPPERHSNKTKYNNINLEMVAIDVTEHTYVVHSNLEENGTMLRDTNSVTLHVKNVMDHS